MKLICRIFGHYQNYPGWSSNGYVKGTYWTNRPIPMYQRQCYRCNRFYGKKIRNIKNAK